MIKQQKILENIASIITLAGETMVDDDTRLLIGNLGHALIDSGMTEDLCTACWSDVADCECECATRKIVAAGGVSCGLNADWSSRAWHFAGADGGLPNRGSGEYYILEDDAGSEGCFELVRRFDALCGDDNDEIFVIMSCSAAGIDALISTVKALTR